MTRMSDLPASVCLLAAVVSFACGCSNAPQANQPVRVKIYTKDGDVGYATGREAVLECVMVNDTNNLRRLIAEGQDIKTPVLGMAERWTFLHLAVYKGHEEAARLLLEHGVDANAQATNGSTALFIAQSHHQTNLVDLLRKYGAK